MIDAASRLKVARLHSGKTPAEIAALSEINLPSYYDLENYPVELASNISLGQLRKLTRALGISAPALFANEPIDKTISLSDLSARIKEHLKAHSMTVEKFIEEVGYDIAPALETPDSILDWNIDCLHALSDRIGVNWLAAIPA